MNAITFDTLKYANTLKAAGIPSEQAEAQAGALSDVLEINLKDLVTKEYLDTRLANLEQRTEARFVQLEQRMTIKLGTMLAAAVGAVVALMKLL
ncbi:MAG: CCDC90 family protein [Rhodanobacter sp.]|jgi:hypothetical protein|nr:CCDC90 family protein [Rhodanobacter sp.]